MVYWIYPQPMHELLPHSLAQLFEPKHYRIAPLDAHHEAKHDGDPFDMRPLSFGPALHNHVMDSIPSHIPISKEPASMPPYSPHPEQ